jgi:inosine triphosphate pyrophosphatase
MSIYFITGNKNKFEEAKAVLPELEMLEIDLPEIQEVNSEEIIKAKLLEALKHQEGEFVVEDTSLSFECLNGLPGPFIKWFLQEIGNEGLFNLVAKMGNNKAEAKTMVGYAKNKDEIKFFEGSIKGQIVKPEVETNFGWDPIFKPEGKEMTFAEMTKDEKNELSMRRKAFEKLKEEIK